MDLCQGDPSGLGHYMELKTMREAEQGLGKATSKLRRFTINLDTRMTAMTTPQVRFNLENVGFFISPALEKSTVKPRYTGPKSNGNPPITNAKPRSLQAISF